MANSSSSSSKSSSSSSKNSSSKRRNRTPGSRGSLLNNLAFYAVIFLALVMIINAILAILNKCGIDISTTATGILTKISLAIAITITVIASYHVAHSKGRNMYILWLVSAILVVLSYVLGIALL